MFGQIVDEFLVREITRKRAGPGFGEHRINCKLVRSGITKFLFGGIMWLGSAAHSQT